MPKQKITQDMVVQAAFDLAREGGVEQVLVKNIALRLGCSVQPIYSYCENMDGLRQKLVERTAQWMRAFVAQRIDPQNPFESLGLAHLAFAREEPHLFRLYFLRRRADLHSIEDIYASECDPRVAAHLSASMGIPLARAKALHVDMLLYNFGICAILATSGCAIPTQQLAGQLQQAHRTFAAQAVRDARETKGE